MALAATRGVGVLLGTFDKAASRWIESCPFGPANLVVDWELLHFAFRHFPPTAWVRLTAKCSMLLFVSRLPSCGAWAVDTFQTNFHGVGLVYAAPPCSVMDNWLLHMKQHPSMRCVLVCPFQESSLWWPLSQGLHNTSARRPLLFRARYGIFWMPCPSEAIKF